MNPNQLLSEEVIPITTNIINTLKKRSKIESAKKIEIFVVNPCSEMFILISTMIELK